MISIGELEQLVGRGISEICRNGFHNSQENHCAHFVSHALGISLPFNCKQYVGGRQEGANIRVHELFSECPRVGLWQRADTAKAQLIFVTRRVGVDIESKTMQNIPQKHIGIYANGNVYHYSNTNNRVVKQSVDEFFEQFKRIYSGEQGLFFGDFPSSSLHLNVDVTGRSVNAPLAFALRKDGQRWMAQRVGATAAEEFFVGSEIKQPERKFWGIFHPSSREYGPLFDGSKWESAIDHWAYILDATSECESNRRFNKINTYDRARFTFGFYQMAAHTPKDNLILFFRQSLHDAQFRDLFSELRLIGGRVFRRESDGTDTDLEEEALDPPTREIQLQRFMAYLNPTRTEIDEQEVLQAARLVWWANTSQTCLDLQVRVAASILQAKMANRYARWYDLDGELDLVCAVIADIHHQGRAKRAEVARALSERNKVDALLKIGQDAFPERVRTLTARLKKWTDNGKLGNKRYHVAANEFR